LAELVLVDHQPDWSRQFAVLAGELQLAFEGADVCIEHIGSTAVPGLCAKPVLDVLLGAGALSEIEARVPALARLGFIYRPEHEAALPARRYFTRNAVALPASARVHLHAVVVNAAIWQQHMAFRNALRASPPLRAQYAALKRVLAAEHLHDKAAYTAAKGPFIVGVVSAALAAGTADPRGAA